MRELTIWLSGAADADNFPYSPVLAEFHRVGKHFAERELLALLDKIRAQVTTPAAGPPTRPAVRLLRDFLDVALDKWDGRYDYRSYLALRLLRLPVDGDDGHGAGDHGHGAGDHGHGAGDHGHGAGDHGHGAGDHGHG
ncbi:hypothetical protein ACGFIG_26860, partial [Micromonospora sp. NPDC049048]